MLSLMYHRKAFADDRPKVVISHFHFPIPLYVSWSSYIPFIPCILKLFIMHTLSLISLRTLCVLWFCPLCMLHLLHELLVTLLKFKSICLLSIQVDICKERKTRLEESYKSHLSVSAMFAHGQNYISENIPIAVQMDLTGVRFRRL